MVKAGVMPIEQVLDFVTPEAMGEEKRGEGQVADLFNHDYFNQADNFFEGKADNNGIVELLKKNNGEQAAQIFQEQIQKGKSIIDALAKAGLGEEEAKKVISENSDLFRTLRNTQNGQIRYVENLLQPRPERERSLLDQAFKQAGIELDPAERE